jgi:short subunit dehydrogenase
MPSFSSDKTLLLIGGSRGLGFALAEEYLKRGWTVVATERSGTTSQLHALLEASDGRLEIDTLDITYPDQVRALRTRLASRRFDMLLVNARIGIRETIADVSTDEFIRIMVTNALSPMRIIESMQDLLLPTGTIGIMSSGQGSITNNENGHNEIYRARTLLLIAPGWVQTELGGPQARLSVEESMPNLANTMDAQAGTAGLQYLDPAGFDVFDGLVCTPWGGRHEVGAGTCQGFTNR